jgi:hypothetical protein
VRKVERKYKGLNVECRFFSLFCLRKKYILAEVGGWEQCLTCGENNFYCSLLISELSWEEKQLRLSHIGKIYPYDNNDERGVGGRDAGLSSMSQTTCIAKWQKK